MKHLIHQADVVHLYLQTMGDWFFKTIFFPENSFICRIHVELLRMKHLFGRNLLKGATPSWRLAGLVPHQSCEPDVSRTPWVLLDSRTSWGSWFKGQGQTSRSTMASHDVGEHLLQRCLLWRNHTSQNQMLALATVDGCRTLTEPRFKVFRNSLGAAVVHDGGFSVQITPPHPHLTPTSPKNHGRKYKETCQHERQTWRSH